jgi:hypothetical protein
MVSFTGGRPAPSAEFAEGIVVRTATEPSRIDGMQQTGGLLLTSAGGPRCALACRIKNYREPPDATSRRKS